MPGPRLTTYSTCTACTARLLWCMTVNGRRMPLNERPAADGNVLVTMLPDGTIRGRVLTGDDLPATEPAYVPHHRTCPAAADYRRRRDAGQPKCQRLDCRQPLDSWLVQQGYTRHICCLTPAGPDLRALRDTPPPAPVVEPEPVHEQGDLFGDAL